MHDQFAGFMRGCEFYNPIPNLFSLFYDKDEEFLFDRAIVYGLETNLWLELGGFWLMALLVVTILIPVFILMSKAKSEKLADFGKKCSGYYRYNAPIRLLLLAYLEITIAALLQMLGFN